MISVTLSTNIYMYIGVYYIYIYYTCEHTTPQKKIQVRSRLEHIDIDSLWANHNLRDKFIHQPEEFGPQS
jgi:hypothetical protein